MTVPVGSVSAADGLYLTLSLLVLRVVADHADLTLSLDDLALFANRFY